MWKDSETEIDYLDFSYIVEIMKDERHVTYAIRSKFDDIEGINMDIGKEYQEKLIQYPIRIPCMNKDETEFYIMCLLSENELNETEFEDLLKFLQAKRKQNSLEFSITMEILKEYDERIATKLNDSLDLLVKSVWIIQKSQKKI